MLLLQAPDDFDLLLNAADKAGVIVLLLAFIAALYRRWIVMGATHTECTTARDNYRQLLDSNAQRIEAKLERLEAERGRSHAQ